MKKTYTQFLILMMFLGVSYRMEKRDLANMFIKECTQESSYKYFSKHSQELAHRVCICVSNEIKTRTVIAFLIT